MRRSLLCLLLAAASLAQVIALTNATLIDGTGAAARGGVTIVMDGGRIVDLGPAARVPTGATVVNVAGKFVVPGIINAHGHVGENRDPQLRQYALYGVTTTTSMAIDPDDIAQFKEEQKRGNLRGARILTVKYRFTSPPLAGSDYKTPEEARAKVDEIVSPGHRLRQGLGGRAGRPLPHADARILRRRFRSGAQARQDHHGAHRRIRRRQDAWSTWA